LKTEYQGLQTNIASLETGLKEAKDKQPSYLQRVSNKLRITMPKIIGTKVGKQEIPTQPMESKTSEVPLEAEVVARPLA